ncbi:hypothetical protein [Nocardia sp. Marseille-Q1738]
MSESTTRTGLRSYRGAAVDAVCAVAADFDATTLDEVVLAIAGERRHEIEIASARSAPGGAGARAGPRDPRAAPDHGRAFPRGARARTTPQLEASDRVAQIMDALYLHSGGVVLAELASPPASAAERADRVAR